MFDLLSDPKGLKYLAVCRFIFIYNKLNKLILRKNDSAALYEMSGINLIK